MSFVVWGLYHGSFLALERSAFGAWLDRIPRALAHAYSLLVVVVGWVFFRADDLSGGVDFLAAMFGAGAEASGSAGIHLNSRVMVTFAMAVLLSFPAPARLRKALEGPADGEGLSVGDVSLSVLRMAGLVIVGLLCGGTLASGTHDPFIYFRF